MGDIKTVNITDVVIKKYFKCPYCKGLTYVYDSEVEERNCDCEWCCKYFLVVK